MPNNITRTRTAQSLTTLFVAVFVFAAPALADEVRLKPDSAARISDIVYALADHHRPPIHIFGADPARPSAAELVLRGRPFETDCVVFSKTMADLLNRAGIKAKVITVSLPPTAPCARVFEGGRATCAKTHAIAVWRGRDGKDMAADIRRPRPMPLDQLMVSSNYSFIVDHGGR